MIKGQEKLIETINALDTLPHSILLLGEEGAVHKEVCEYIANRFNLVPYDITEFINHEYIEEINASTTPSLYYINTSIIGEKEQNIILKLFEEPSVYCYLILNCESDDLIIDTIKSRSYLLKLERYKREQLYELIDDKNNSSLILKLCTTPGQIEVANHTNIPALYELCSKMLTVMDISNFQNALGVATKINYKDEYDKFDLMLFLRTLKIALLDVEIKNKLNINELIIEHIKYIKNMNNKQLYLENMLIRMWELSHNLV